MAVPYGELLSDLADLEVKGREAAFSLFAINRLTLNEESAAAEIVKQLFCIVGVIPTLRDLLAVTPDVPLFNVKQVGALLNYSASCRPILNRIDVAVRESEDWFRPFSSRTPLQSSASFYSQSVLSDAQNMLSTVFVHMALMISAAKAEHPSRLGVLANDGAFECHHLRAALKHIVFTRKQELVNSPLVPLVPPAPPAPPAPATSFPPVFEPVPIDIISIGTNSPFPSQITQQKDVIELQHPRGFRGRYGHPDYPLPHKQAHVQLWPLDPTVRFDTSFEEAELLRQKQLREKKHYPDIAAFSGCPPISIEPGSIQGHSHRSMTSSDWGEDTSDVVHTPGSTRESTPTAVDTIPQETTAQKATTSDIEPKTFPKFSIKKPDAKFAIRKATNQYESSPETSSKSLLEAYVLRPVCQDCHLHIEWYHIIDQLPLENAEIQAHIRKLGSDYSVIESIAGLLPEQLRLIRERVRARQGHLQSVQYGRDVDMVTNMGTFQIKSVVFVLRTDLAPELDIEYEKRATSISAPLPPFGGIPPTVNPFPCWSQLGTDIDEYAKKLKAQGEVCLYLEKDPHNATKAQHFQSVHFDVPYKDLSFEEAHLADLKAGRTGPLQASSNVFSTNTPSSTLKTGGLFDRPTTRRDLVDRSSWPAGGLFGASRPAAPGGLFGGFAKRDSTSSPFGTAIQNSTGLFTSTGTHNIFARPNPGWGGGLGTQSPGSSSPGLFGESRTTSTTEGPFNEPKLQSPTPASTNGLFREPIIINHNLPSTGVFGTSRSTTTSSTLAASETLEPTRISTPTTTQRLSNEPNLQSAIPPSSSGLFREPIKLQPNSPSTSSLFGTPRSTTTGGPFATSGTPEPTTTSSSPFSSPETTPTGNVSFSFGKTNTASGFTLFANTTPQTGTAQPDDRPPASPAPFSNATATFRPVFSTSTTGVITTSAPLAPVLAAGTVSPPIGEPHVAQSDNAECRSDGSTGSVPLQHPTNIALPDEDEGL